MDAEFYLVIGAKKQYARRKLSGLRVTRKKPSTGPEEIAVKVTMSIPDALFERPEVEASIVVPASGERSTVVTAEVCDNIETIIRQQTGLSVSVRAVDQDDDADS